MWYDKYTETVDLIPLDDDPFASPYLVAQYMCNMFSPEGDYAKNKNNLLKCTEKENEEVSQSFEDALNTLLEHPEEALNKHKEKPYTHFRMRCFK